MTMKDTAALKRAILARPGGIWIPADGGRIEDPRIGNLQRRLTEYDQDLVLGRHEESGTWAVYTKRSPVWWGDVPYPIFNLGFEVPSEPSKVIYDLQQIDAVRKGEALIREINEHNDAIRREQERKVEHGTDAAVEAYEWGFRKMGSHPTPRVFVPASEPVERIQKPVKKIWTPKEGDK